MIGEICDYRGSFVFAIERQIFLIEFFPKTVDMWETILIHRFLVEAATVSEHPLEMIVNGKHRLYKHLTGSVHCDDYKHPLTIAQGPCSRLRNHHIHVNEDKGSHAVYEQPNLKYKYQVDTKNTFSVSYFFPPCCAVEPFVPQDTSSTLQKACATMVWA